MLKALYIRNYALIEDLTVQFERGLNIITGETGAGKSIIIDALSLILGERADSSMVRKGADKAIVEGAFIVTDNNKLRKLLAENSLDWQAEMIVRRELSVKGQSRCFINDSPATIALLKEVGDMLVDLHGQHEHQSLLRSETHCGMLDDYGNLSALAAEFGEAFNICLTTLNDLRELHARERQLIEKKTFYEFQLREIDAVGPREGEEADLEAELLILENSERLYAATERLYQMMYEGENAIHDQLVLARNELETLCTIDKSFEGAKDEISSAVIIVNELAKFIQQYNSRVEFNPERLEEIRNRLGHITLLKKKYGGSLESVLDHRSTIARELELANNFDTELASLHKQRELHRKACTDIGQRLSAKRHEVAKKLDRSVEVGLGDLGIGHPRFETRITQSESKDPERAVIKTGSRYLEATPEGFDSVEFFLSTNIGEDPKPLVKVASGGEVSRVMLALKMILAKSDRLPLLVFDEIDVGVSGRIALAVGQALKKLSQFHQVIAISHLPQIASLADTHFVVEKVEDKKRSRTHIRSLDLDERVKEVAKLMSGVEVTEHGLESARELMGIK